MNVRGRSPQTSEAAGVKPTELSVGLNAFLQVGAQQWFLRRVRVYADPAVNPPRYRARAYLEARPEGDPLEPRKPLGVELTGEGPDLLAAVAALVVQVLPACPLLRGEELPS